MKTVLRLLLISNLAFFCMTATTSQAAGTPEIVYRYERWISPLEATPLERRLLRVTKGWAITREHRIHTDPRLQRAARRLVRDAPMRKDGRIDIEPIRMEAHRWGWCDGQIAAVMLRRASTQGFGVALKEELAREIGGLEVNRVGLASTTFHGTTTVLVLLSRRVIDLEPTPSRLAKGKLLRLRGAITAESNYIAPRSMQLAVQQPNGSVSKTTLTLKRRHFSVKIPLGKQAGLARIEILIDRGSGPEIAAMFPVGVATPLIAKPTPSIVSNDEREETAASLTALILGSRSAHDLDLPAQSIRLQNAAISHAREMSKEGFFAHVSPTTGDATDRLRARGIRYARALENIAIADSVESIFEQWMTSPAHRANLHDPQINAIGVAVEPLPNTKESQFCAVAVLAKLADDGAADEIATRAFLSINAKRKHLHLPLLARDRRLDQLAARHSREIAGSGKVHETSPIHGNIVDTVFAELAVEQAAADVFLASSVTAAEKSKHVRGSYSQVGVGVFREERNPNGGLWVTVIYASH